jgi:hypothetical protein
MSDPVTPEPLSTSSSPDVKGKSSDPASPVAAAHGAPPPKKRRDVVHVDPAVVEVLSPGSFNANEKKDSPHVVLKDCVRKMGDVAPKDLQILTPQTERLWIRIANCQRTGLSVTQICELYKFPENLLTALVKDARYQHFYSSFVKELSQSPEQDQVQQMVMANAIRGQEALRWVLELPEKDLETAKDNVGGIVAAAKASAAAVGVDTERKRHNHLVAHALLTPKKSGELTEALVKEGA